MHILEKVNEKEDVLRTHLDLRPLFLEKSHDLLLFQECLKSRRRCVLQDGNDPPSCGIAVTDFLVWLRHNCCRLFTNEFFEGGVRTVVVAPFDFDKTERAAPWHECKVLNLENCRSGKWSPDDNIDLS